MMNVQEIFAEARRHGVHLLVLDGKLKASPPGILPADLRSAIRKSKGAE
jgi:hypothetical protein